MFQYEKNYSQSFPSPSNVHNSGLEPACDKLKEISIIAAVLEIKHFFLKIERLDLLLLGSYSDKVKHVAG